MGIINQLIPRGVPPCVLATEKCVYWYLLGWYVASFTVTQGTTALHYIWVFNDGLPKFTKHIENSSHSQIIANESHRKKTWKFTDLQIQCTPPPSTWANSFLNSMFDVPFGGFNGSFSLVFAPIRCLSSFVRIPNSNVLQALLESLTPQKSKHSRNIGHVVSPMP